MNERLCQVNSVTDVVDRTGMIVGALHPGHKYRVLDESSLEFAVGATYLMLRLPDHSVGYVAKRQVLSDSERDLEPEAERDLDPDPEDGGGSPPPWLTVAIAGLLMIVGLVVGLGVARSLNDDGASSLSSDSDTTSSTIAASQPAETSAVMSTDDQSTDDIDGPAVDSPPEREPIDLAAGVLPFAVTEAEPVAVSGLLIGGVSSKYVFGTPEIAQLDGGGEVIVIERESRQEVARFAVGDGDEFITSVLDRGHEVWLGLANQRHIVIFGTECICLTNRRIDVDTVSVKLMFERREFHEGDRRPVVFVDDYDRETQRADVRIVDSGTKDTLDRRELLGGESAGVGEGVNGATEALGDLWLSNPDSIWRIGPNSTVVERIPFDDEGLNGVLAVGDALYAVGVSTGRLHRVALPSGTVDSIVFANYEGADRIRTSLPVVDKVIGSIWITTAHDQLVAIDPTSLTVVHRLELDANLGFPHALAGYIWVPTTDNLLVIDPESGEIATILPNTETVSSQPPTMIVLDDQVWLHDFSLSGLGGDRTYVIDHLAGQSN